MSVLLLLTTQIYAVNLFARRAFPVAIFFSSICRYFGNSLTTFCTLLFYSETLTVIVMIGQRSLKAIYHLGRRSSYFDARIMLRFH